MKNDFDENLIKYDVSIINGNGNQILAEKTGERHFDITKGTSGKINVKSYINGVLTNNPTENFPYF